MAPSEDEPEEEEPSAGKTCYACDAPATTKEHAPPKCFFPQQKDLPDKDRRKELITVPSCEEHNTAASKDDEYTLAILAAAAENNDVAKRLYGTKMSRALAKSTGLLVKLLDGSQIVQVDGQHSRALKMERERVDRTMAKAARAVYFHEFSAKWRDGIRVESSAFVGDTLEPINEQVQLGEGIDKLLAGTPVKGTNADVFTYQAFRHDELGFAIVRMTFYDGLCVVAMSGRGLLGTIGPDGDPGPS